MNNLPHIKVLILNYNGEKILNRCVQSVLDTDYENLSIDVIDNNSQDASIILLKEKFDNVEVHQTEKNLGFGGGYNFAFNKLKKTDAEYYLLLNNDAILSKKIIQNLLINMNRYGKENLYAPKILYTNSSKLWFAGGTYNKFLGIARHIGINTFENNIFYKAKKVDYVTACCLFISKSTIELLNGFDTDYKMYYEDVDLCHRASIKGFNSYLIDSEPIEHEVSYSLGNHSFKKRYHMFLSQIKFIYKHNNFFIFLISCLINFFILPLYWIKRIIRI